MMIEEVIEKFKAALADSEYDAVLVFGPDNVQYLSGAHLPFTYSYPDRNLALLWPKGGEPVCVCPVEWESTFRNLSWIDKTVGYVEMPADHSKVVCAIVELINTSGISSGKIGIDLNRVPLSLYDELEEAMPKAKLASCDEWLSELRVVKTGKEVELLEDLAYRCDHAIFGVMHHVLVTSTRSEMSLSEEIRVHAMERELDVIGHHSVGPSASGEHAKKFWPLAPNYGIGFDKHLKPGEYVRMELRTSLDGYWSEGARMMAQGEPTEEQLVAYKALVKLRKAAMAAIKPGVKCSSVYEAVREKAAKKGVELVPGLGVGHGVGVTSYEPPYLTASEDAELRSGMVVVLSPVIHGPDGEIMMSKDTVIVEDGGCRLVGWYMDWREPYVANYTL